jgi:lysine 2,3-aminomutase
MSIIPADKDEPPSAKHPRRPPPWDNGNISDRDWNDWKWQLKNAVTTLEGLRRFGNFSPEELARLSRVAGKYPFLIPPYYLSLIDFADPGDPIRIQSFPSAEEIELVRIGEEDPLDEETDMAVPGLVHRYPDRVLMQITDMCPMFCRHCTRKREWEEGNWARSDMEIERMLGYLSETRQIRDVLISGGDPLILSTRRLEYVLQRLRAIQHIEIIRLGTRFPVVLPQRIDEELTAMLKRHRPVWINTHFNHPREITPEARAACDRVLCSGIPMNNQSVLLKGVNDSVEIMTRLCHELLKIGVRPYYLYQCDPVRGTEHLRTSVWKGIEIIEGMRGHTTGFAVPTFVVDAPGGGGKIPVGPNYLVAAGEDHVVLRNYEGFTFRYEFPKDGASARWNDSPAERYQSDRMDRRKHRLPGGPLPEPKIYST